MEPAATKHRETGNSLTLLPPQPSFTTLLQYHSLETYRVVTQGQGTQLRELLHPICRLQQVTTKVDSRHASRYPWRDETDTFNALVWCMQPACRQARWQAPQRVQHGEPPWIERIWLLIVSLHPKWSELAYNRTKASKKRQKCATLA